MVELFDLSRGLLYALRLSAKLLSWIAYILGDLYNVYLDHIFRVCDKDVGK